LTLDQFQAVIENVTRELRKVIIGQEEALRYSLLGGGKRIRPVL